MEKNEDKSITVVLGFGNYITSGATCNYKNNPKLYPAIRIEIPSENVKKYIGKKLPKRIKSKPFINICFMKGQILFNVIGCLLVLCEKFYPAYYKKIVLELKGEVK